MNEIVSPLKSIVDLMASKNVVGPEAKRNQRFREATDVSCVLCDCSGSMNDLVGNSGYSKFRHLQIALDDVLVGFPGLRIVAFASLVKVVNTPAEMPDPRGLTPLGSGTNLTGALVEAAKWQPRRTIVITDGIADCTLSALKIADQMTGQIDTIYCGADGMPAIEFLQKLARTGCGRPVTWDFRQEISGTIRNLLLTA